MSIRRFVGSLAFFSLLWLAQFATASEEAMLLDEAANLFSKTPYIFDMKISPDGKHFFVSADEDGDQTASIFEMRTNKPKHVISFDRGWKIGDIVWISNSEIAITPRVMPILRNYEVVTGDLVVYGIDGKSRKIIYGPSARGSQQTGMAGRIRSSGGALIIDPMLEEDRTMLVQIYERYKTGVAKINTRSGSLQGLRYGPERSCQFALDADKQLKYCSAVDDITSYPTIYELVDNDWVPVYTGDTRERVVIIAALKAPGKFLATKESDSSITGVYEFDSKTKKFSELFVDDVFDVYSVTENPEFGVVAIDARDPKASYLYLEGESVLSDSHSTLSASFPGKFISITSATSDGQKLIARVGDAQNPGSFYFYDREKGEIRYLAKRFPWLDAESLVDMQSFNFETSDGLLVHGLYTPGVNGGKKGTVVMPHGGPHGPFDGYGYRGQVQFFAQMDIGVIQVNFRGSGGYGRRFEEAGYREWSGKMIDDIIESAEYIKRREQLPDQMCIYGASYGAFAAASAVFRYPDYFECAAGHVGVYDLPEMFVSGDIPESEAGRAFLRRVLSNDEAKLRADSPSFNVDKINVPMLLTAGESDFRAPPVQTEIMEERLIAAGKDVEATYTAREGHGFGDSENEEQRLLQTGRFILRHLAK